MVESISPPSPTSTRLRSALAESLGIIEEIRSAAPTDGLWNDGRTDEEQLEATYAELEWAMAEIDDPSAGELTERQHQVMTIYRRFNQENAHKMNPIPVFKRQSLL